MKKIINTLFIISTTAILAGWINTPKAALIDGLIIYYPFNGDIADKSGNGNNATASGGSFSADRLGNKESAYKLNGGTDKLTINNAKIGHLSSGTISLFFSLSSKLDQNSSGQWLITSDPSGDTNGDVSLAINRTNCGSGPSIGSGKINFEVQGDFKNTNTCPGTGLVQLLSATNSWSTSWYHLAVTFDGKLMKIYINGVLENSTPSTSGIFNTGVPIYFGYHAQYNGNPFTGYVDEFRLYNRVLDQNEVQQLYTLQNNDLPSNSQDCLATYTLDGKLHIPCVTVPDVFGGKTTYEADMQLIPSTNSLNFQLTGAKPK